MTHEARRGPPYADPDAAARKLLELAAGVVPIDGRIHIEKINAPFLSKTGCKATGAEFATGLQGAIDKGWLELRESGTFVKLTSPPEKLLAK
ncbi:hypothetical protein SAMN05216330_12317 [Bradyrhizobium sp. Ghvi]|uniref:hypothetical protein n=1 Tax=Bradyrhizobium sp. Ghvi TaxID=1855319 RepID=UPI0008E172B7|nr:hypothetical protein [Bradyrhizobium sp. Ghvi]SFQ28077.1 hypothetical protein SAMN05216330_12317 [Bradyrhizobium sp. Ghvi]